MTVNASASAEALAHRRFVILPAVQTIKNTDLLFQENARLLARALEKRGFVSVPGTDAANTAIYLEYMSEKSEDKTVHYGPVAGQIAASSVTAKISAADLDEFRRSGKALDLWRIQVSAENPIGDIRMVFPYLVVAGVPYIGKTTDRPQKFIMATDDARVTGLISATFPPPPAK